MTNFERLFQEQMKDPEFAQAYHTARWGRMLDEFLASLKEKITNDEPKENLLHFMDAMQKQLGSLLT